MSVDDILEINSRVQKNGFTKAGRAYQKHSNREDSFFSKVSGGDPRPNNLAGEIFLTETLRDTTSIYKINKLGGFDVIRTDGKGIRFRPNGEIYSFREPNLSQ
jgi:hypothetical protein